MPAGQQARDLLVFPCNGNGLEALDCLGQAWRCIGFVDDTPAKQRDGAFGYPVHDRQALAVHPQAKVLAVPGGPQSYMARRQVIDSLGVAPDRFATVIHPAAHVSPLAKIGHNVLVMAGAVITSNAVIGDNVCILPNTVVHHDVVIGPWTLIGSNVSIAGSVKVGENCYIGTGTRIIQGITIGDGALLGLGSNVIRDVAAGDRVAGNPARPLPRKS
jgi:sugar O-acyltransferase (sialic acid O-acetyltransferase NeuD family)